MAPLPPRWISTSSDYGAARPSWGTVFRHPGDAFVRRLLTCDLREDLRHDPRRRERQFRAPELPPRPRGAMLLPRAGLNAPPSPLSATTAP
jgi:hypothetical protein